MIKQPWLLSDRSFANGPEAARRRYLQITSLNVLAGHQKERANHIKRSGSAVNRSSRLQLLEVNVTHPIGPTEYKNSREDISCCQLNSDCLDFTIHTLT